MSPEAPPPPSSPSSEQAIAADDTELAVGSIIGSNIANVLLVLGLAATIGTIRVASRSSRVDIPVMIGASITLLLLALDGRIDRLDGVVMVLGITSFIAWTVRSARAADSTSSEPSHPAEHEPVAAASGRLPQLIGTALVSTAGLAVAARFVVQGAEDIAASLGIPELIIGLTVVALGTSAPEIATTLIAAVRGQRDLAVGNAVGSNIFNILLVLGSAGLLSPSGIGISDDALRLDIPILVAAAVACLPIVAFDHRIERWEGMLFVSYYVAYTIFLVLDGTGHRATQPFAVVMLGFVVPITAVTAGVLIAKGRRRRQISTNSQNKGCLNTYIV